MEDTTLATQTPANGAKPMSLRTRLLIAIPLGLVFLVIGVAVFLPGFFLGGMATDSCGGLGAWFVWLYLWGIVILASALWPPILIIRGRPRRQVLLCIAAGFGASVLWYVLWFVILTFACH